MLPYFEVNAVRLGPVWVRSQLLLAAIGILVAHFLFLRRARRSGLDLEVAGWMSFSMAVFGVMGAFLFRWAYLPEWLARDPWIWLKTTQGAASFGGIAGGLLAGVAYLHLRGIGGRESWAYLDALAFVFPFGWILGRVGCSLIHDHPGLRSESWLAVRYPDFPRWDLAVLEVLFLGLVLIPLFWVLSRRKWPQGFYLGLFLTVYGVFRVWLDGFHVDPPRFWGMTVDRWAYGLAGVLGAAILWRIWRRV